MTIGTKEISNLKLAIVSIIWSIFILTLGVVIGSTNNSPKYEEKLGQAEKVKVISDKDIKLKRIFDSRYHLYVKTPISPELVDRIGSIDGVSEADKLDRYTMILIIGKLFDAEDIREEVKKVLSTFKYSNNQ